MQFIFTSKTLQKEKEKSSPFKYGYQAKSLSLREKSAKYI